MMPHMRPGRQRRIQASTIAEPVAAASLASLTPLPSENHHKHSPEQGRIRWQLVIKSHYQ
jgi:hypothetical protein